jgi:CheY-like chemotaxis protein
MDLNMPQLNGFEASIEIHEFIKNHPTQGRQAPTIVALTASVLGTVREECERAHMKGFLSKPLSVDQLRAVLANCDKMVQARIRDSSSTTAATA